MHAKTMTYVHTNTSIDALASYGVDSNNTETNNGTLS